MTYLTCRTELIDYSLTQTRLLQQTATSNGAQFPFQVTQHLSPPCYLFQASSPQGICRAVSEYSSSNSLGACILINSQRISNVLDC